VPCWRCPVATGLPQAIGARLGIPLSADNSLVLGLNFGCSVLISKAAHFQLVVGLDVAGPSARTLSALDVFSDETRILRLSRLIAALECRGPQRFSYSPCHCGFHPNGVRDLCKSDGVLADGMNPRKAVDTPTLRPCQALSRR